MSVDLLRFIIFVAVLGASNYTYAEARWIAPGAEGSDADVEDFSGKYRPQMARDIDQAPVFLAKSSWETGYVSERFPKIAFTKTKERG